MLREQDRIYSEYSLKIVHPDRFLERPTAFGRPTLGEKMKRFRKRRVISLGRVSIATRSVWVGTLDEFTGSLLRYP